MASPYYVDSTATGGSNDGTSWANAFLTFAQAVAAATTAADSIYVSHAHSESLSAAATYTFGANVHVLCLNSGTNALATTAVIGAQASSYAITLTGAYNVYLYGITLRMPGTTAGRNIAINGADGGHFELENCNATFSSTSSGSGVLIGINSVNSFTVLRNFGITFGDASQVVVLRGSSQWEGGSVAATGSVPTVAFSTSTSVGTQTTTFSGVNLSQITTTLFGNQVTGTPNVTLVNCKLGSGVTIKEAASTVLNKGNITVTAFNCNAGDAHYSLYHGDAFGETTVSTAIYANDGAAYDGTNKCSWKIVTTANCTYWTPYVSPWMDIYHSGTSAISPYLEILRSGSTTKYQNDEVWGEFSYQGTSGSTNATIVNDRMTPLGTAADQTASSLDASGWTGEDATNNAYMKLEAGSITPAEIGHIRARVCVGEPSITVYVDPKIRGLS